MRTHIHSEQELLEQLQEGGEHVIAALFNRHYTTLMIFAQRYVSFEAAQDILSETFVKFWSQKGEFISEAKIYQWLKITVRNAAVNHLRSSHHMDQKPLELMEQVGDAYEEDFYEAAVESGLFTRIVDEIKGLPAQQQRIIRMFFLEAKDNAAIANELDISVQAVKNQKVTALKALRKTFSADDLMACLMAVMATMR